MIKEGIQQLVQNVSLSREQAKTIMTEIMSGNTTPTQIGAFLIGLRMKGETVEEISAFAEVMREFCHRIYPKSQGRILDIVGTGGDHGKTFNISSISAIVAAGANIVVAKHGSRAVTSQCGSADLFEQLGYNLALTPEEVESVISDVGLGFMYAPSFHPAMKYAVGPRKDIGVRTVFNILGPLSNPAFANGVVLGVFSSEWLKPFAEVLLQLGCEKALVMHGFGGLDEISTLGPTSILRVQNGEIISETIHPKEYGLTLVKPQDIQGSTPEENRLLTFNILQDKVPPKDPRREIVLLNAAAGIMVGGQVDTIHEGLEVARESISSGSAYAKLKQMVHASKGNPEILEELEQQNG